MKPLFEMGHITGTPAALDAMEYAEVIPENLLRRHVSGNWGDVSEEDAKENDFSVKHGFRILSSYKLDTGVTIWIITEADRSATTFLLSSEY
jgi:hypothetical protein